MKLLPTILLAIGATACITASVFLTIDGNLAKLTGWYRVTPGMPLFTNEHTEQFSKVCWFRLTDLHEQIECSKDADGTWWIVSPFRDKLNPIVVDYLLAFAESATIVDTLSMDETSRQNMRDFGFSSDFCAVTLKVPAGDDDLTTAARFKLGKEAPWLASYGDGKKVIPTTYLQTDFYGDDDRVHVVSGNITPLFAKGLKNLRDPKPLRFDPNDALSITIKERDMAPLVLERENAESLWLLKTENNTTQAEQEDVAKLLGMLGSLDAVRVQNAADVKLEGQPTHVITVKGSKTPPQTLRLYDTFAETNEFSAIGSLCRATVDGRDVVFTLRATPKSSRKGGYSAIVNAVFSMPVLPAAEIAKYRGLNDAYTEEMPLSLTELRSRRLSSFDERDVESILIRYSGSSYPTRLTLIPGIQESNTQDAWMVEAQGRTPVEAETEIVRNFLRSFRTIPVEDIVADLPSAQDEQKQDLRRQLIRNHGLFTPDYRIFIMPKSCALRTSIFGTDLPLVKDRDVKVFAVALCQNPETGDFERYAMEENGNTIYKLSHKHTRHFSMQQNVWKSRTLLGFHVSELKRFTLDYQHAPLVLDYESIAESWSGTLGGVDVTANINPHRALNCVDRLRKIKVKEWLDEHDADALAKLENPAFRLILELEKVDHSEAEAIVADADELGHDNMQEDGSYRADGAAAALEEDSNLDDKFREQAFAVRPVKNVTYTIEIAPANNVESTPMFYGRIKELGQIFLMSFEDAQSLASSPLDDNVKLMQTEQNN